MFLRLPVSVSANLNGISNRLHFVSGFAVSLALLRHSPEKENALQYHSVFTLNTMYLRWKLKYKLMISHCTHIENRLIVVELRIQLFYRIRTSEHRVALANNCGEDLDIAVGLLNVCRIVFGLQF
ncbi:hypothetical protein OUZ56_012700 [Daphnia magna]|uniref:Uncharacterized protein n=1 Tax=Daphnia magna TaxID=35525 RepID=A0ABQ9Z3S5_9CRUS|nr:hypothetical protein OUZ56_012700 [Daphnia magna]